MPNAVDRPISGLGTQTFPASEIITRIWVGIDTLGGLVEHPYEDDLRWTIKLGFVALGRIANDANGISRQWWYPIKWLNSQYWVWAPDAAYSPAGNAGIPAEMFGWYLFGGASGHVWVEY